MSSRYKKGQRFKCLVDSWAFFNKNEVYEQYKDSYQLQLIDVYGTPNENTDAFAEEFEEVDSNQSIEDMEFLKGLMTRINTQDNRCTASPFYYTIETQVKTFVPEGNGTCTWHYIDDSREEIEEGSEAQHLLEYHLEEYQAAFEIYEEGEELDEWQCSDLLEKLGYTRYYWEYRPKYEGFFMTEESANHHIEINGHNLGHRARTYIKHAHRCPEYKQLLDVLGRITGLPHNEH